MRTRSARLLQPVEGLSLWDPHGVTRLPRPVASVLLTVGVSYSITLIVAPSHIGLMRGVVLLDFGSSQVLGARSGGIGAGAGRGSYPPRPAWGASWSLGLAVAQRGRGDAGALQVVRDGRCACARAVWPMRARVHAAWTRHGTAHMASQAHARTTCPRLRAGT